MSSNKQETFCHVVVRPAVLALTLCNSICFQLTVTSIVRMLLNLCGIPAGDVLFSMNCGGYDVINIFNCSKPGASLATPMVSKSPVSKRNLFCVQFPT